eukprot:744401_1
MNSLHLWCVLCLFERNHSKTCEIELELFKENIANWKRIDCQLKQDEFRRESIELERTQDRLVRVRARIKYTDSALCAAWETAARVSEERSKAAADIKKSARTLSLAHAQLTAITSEVERTNTHNVRESVRSNRE